MGIGGTGKRATLLVTLIGVAVFVAACGRASDNEIFQALGITPTPTQSAEQVATATAQAAAQQTAVAAAAGSPGAGGAVALGDVTRGQRTYNQWCMNCHKPGGQGPDILSAGSAGSGMTLDELTVIVREGTDHTPPGPYEDFRISDRALNDLAAYIAAQAGQ